MFANNHCITLTQQQIKIKNKIKYKFNNVKPALSGICALIFSVTALKLQENFNAE